MRERARARLEQRGRMRRHLAAALDLVAVDRLRVLARGIGAHLVERPAEVDGRRPRRAQHALGLDEVLAAGRCEGIAVGGRDADRRRAANDHRPDRIGDLGGDCGTRPRPPRAAAVAGRGRRRDRPRGAGSAQARATRASATVGYGRRSCDLGTASARYVGRQHDAVGSGRHGLRREHEVQRLPALHDRGDRVRGDAGSPIRRARRRRRSS